MHLDPREKPPENSRTLFKKYQRLSEGTIHDDLEVVDLRQGPSRNPSLVGCIEPCTQRENWTKALHTYICSCANRDDVFEANCLLSVTKDLLPMAYRHRDFPGLIVVSGLLPVQIQASMLSRMLHRDLSNNAHKTNVHFHHTLSYPEPGRSFFDFEPQSLDVVTPKEASTHRSMTVSQFLSKKLRWMTLGGQYDWTRKEYPKEEPPLFPRDHFRFLKSLFPDTDSQAAIVNLYSPGDTLSLHRDVSEECDRGLISLSIGCDGLFMLALDEDEASGLPLRNLVVRLRSGDAVYMTGPSRYAWHGVPQIIPDTCPKELQDWPAKGSSDLSDAARDANILKWKRWMAGKRVNINVRQMWEHDLLSHGHDF